jgi:hypothetical protein
MLATRPASSAADVEASTSMLPVQPVSAKVEGEVVNDLDRLKAALDRGWDLNKKVIGVGLSRIYL